MRFTSYFSSIKCHEIFKCGLDKPGMMVGKSLKMPIFSLIYHDQQGVGNDGALQNSKLNSHNTNSEKHCRKKIENWNPPKKFCLVFVENLPLISCWVHQSWLLADQATDVGFYYLRIYLPPLKTKFRNTFSIYLLLKTKFRNTV